MAVEGHYAVVLLVDPRGRILLQERDEHYRELAGGRS